MKRSKRVVLGLVGLLVLTGVFLSVQRLPEGGSFVKAMPFLAMQKPIEKKSGIYLRERPGLGARASKNYQTYFMIDEEYWTVLKTLEREFKSIGVANGMQGGNSHMYSVMPSASQRKVTVYVREEPAGKTFVSVMEPGKTNIVDRANLWLAKLSGKSKHGQVSIEYANR